MSDAPVPDAPMPVIAGRYEVVRVLGQGSFGRTYLAHDRGADGRLVAVKQLRAEGDDAWKRYELFEREATVLGALRHQGIPAIVEHLRVPREGGEDVYLVMEYIEGASLAQIIHERQHLDPARVLDLLLGLLDILDYLHGRAPPVLHRDLKPANVILRPGGAPALVDFGAVRNVFKAPDEGGSTVVGTYGYMPFEQYMGQASPASDLYALGATVLHLVTGRPPPDFASPEGHVKVPEQLPGGPVLRAVVARLLAPAADQRYASARAAREALLGGALAGAPATALVATTSGALARTDPSLQRRLTSSPVRMLFDSVRPSEPLGAGHYAVYALLSLISGGIMPIIYWVTYRQRRARLAPFFRDGVPAEARVLRTERVSDGIEVAYEFAVDGVTRRGVDTVPGMVARGWQPGDRIQILHLAGDSCDSIVVETT